MIKWMAVMHWKVSPALRATPGRQIPSLTGACTETVVCDPAPLKRPRSKAPYSGEEVVGAAVTFQVSVEMARRRPE